MYYIITFNNATKKREYLNRGGDGKPEWSLSGRGFPDLKDVCAFLRTVTNQWQQCIRDIPHIEWREH